MNVLRAALSGKGYQITRDVMRLNQFLGDLVGGPAVLGEWAFIFCLFGTLSESEPWGWQLFGHHLSLNCLVIGRQMVLTPVLLRRRAELCGYRPVRRHPAVRRRGARRLGVDALVLAEQQRRAIVAHSMMGGDLPEGRRHFADNLHLGGAFQDNRIVPYEGLLGSNLSARQQRDLIDLIAAYVAPLPEGPRAARLAEVERHLAETHFCWIGGFEEQSPFYYRIQSPVIFIEFDHHAGVFLTNAEPAKFHVHTIVRTPNGNDYGIDLLRLHYKHAPHHRHE